MMTTIRVVAAPYGQPALAALASVAGEVKRDDPLASLTIIAPSPLAGVIARRRLAAGVGGRAGFAGLRVMTLADLAFQIAAPMLAPARPAGPAVVSAAWRAALAADPGIFKPVAGHPATVRALVEAHVVLCNADDVTLDRIAEAGRLPAKVVDLHRAARAALRPRFYDDVALLERAATSVMDGPADATDSGALILYLPQDLSAAEGRFASALGASMPMTVIVGLTGVRRADDGVFRSLRRIGAFMPAVTIEPPTAQRIWHASDCDDEVRLVVRAVVESLAARPGHKIAVLYTTASPYARQLHDQFTSAQIATAGPGSVPLAETSIAQGFLGLIRLANTDIRRSDLFDVLAAAPVADPETGERVPAGRWERISRKAAVIAGDDWTIRMDQYVATLQARCDDLADDEQSDPTHYLHRHIKDASALRDFVIRLRNILDNGAAATDWESLVAWGQRLLGLFTNGGGNASPGSEPVGAHISAHPRERAAAALVEAALNDCAQLAEVEPVASIDALIETVTAALESTSQSTGSVGTGVLVAPVSAAIGLVADEVFVLGVAEDIYPGRSHVDPLLPDEVRQLADGELPHSRDRLDTRQRHLLAAFMAGGTVTASFPRGDLRDSGDRLPSQWLLPTLRDLAGDKTLAATDWANATIPGVAGAPSHAAAFLAQQEISLPTMPATEQEWRTRALAAGITIEDPALAKALTSRAARASNEFTRFDGNLSAVSGLPDFSAAAVAPTVLETYADCPHAYFMKHLLGIEPIDYPEETITISNPAIGDLVHECMDRFVRRCGEHLPGFGHPWSAKQRILLDEIFDDVANDAQRSGLTGYETLWRRERARLLTDVRAMLDDDDTWRSQLHARVVASEMRFGEHGFDPVAISLPNGENVLLRGSADKIDLTQDGTVLVTDIKTGKSDAFKDIGSDNPTIGGTKLQLPVYAHAARQQFGDASTPVQALYWFVRSDDPKVRRILLDLSDIVEADYAATLQTLTTSIRAGLFPAKAPKDPDRFRVQCAYCNPDGIGHASVRDRWERKRVALTLRDLVRLIEPDALADLDDDSAASADMQVTQI